MIKKTISIGIPCFNEELNVAEIYKKLLEVTSKNKNYNYEFIFVDNGSVDKTREIIKKIALKDKRIKGVFLSRNFGPESSAKALFDFSNGDAAIYISGDMQDPPSLIPEFIKKWEEGFDIVDGVYTNLKDNPLMVFLRKSFYKIFRLITGINIPIGDSGFGLIDRKVINALNSLPEKYRFYRGLRAWVGFKTFYIKYEKKRRKYGKSSYNFFSYIKHAERSFFGFSYLPLDIIIYIGFALVLFSFIFILIYILLFLLLGNPIKGSVTILISIIFLGGMQLLAISIIGKYIQVIVEETKSRPVYIVEEVVKSKT